MARYQKKISEVQQFLTTVKKLVLCSEKSTINNRPWAGNKVNKTLTYMTETGISKRDIEKVIGELQVCNYSYTADDKNERFSNEQVWIFGITKNLIDKDEDLYIKLKIRIIEGELLLIMSFHPESPEIEDLRLRFPYRD